MEKGLRGGNLPAGGRSWGLVLKLDLKRKRGVSVGMLTDRMCQRGLRAVRPRPWHPGEILGHAGVRVALAIRAVGARGCLFLLSLATTSVSGEETNWSCSIRDPG